MFTSTIEIVNQLIVAGLVPEEAEKLAAYAKPAVWLETRSVEDESEIALGSTKIGGRPDLLASGAWPMRSAYSDTSSRADEYRQQIAQPDKAWSWATPAQQEEVKQECIERLDRIENPFPLHFIAQINFAEMWASGPLDPDIPKTGLLAVFCDIVEQQWGCDPNDAIGSGFVFHDAASTTLVRHETPEPIARLVKYALPALACRPQACMTPLPLATAQADKLDLPKACLDIVHDWWCGDDDLYSSQGGEDWKCHRVGGWPNQVQGDMQTECALVSSGHYCGNGDAYKTPDLAEVRATATDWLLLAQIGTDEKANLIWGDDGQMYVWIRRDHLVARRFDMARLIIQCY